MTGLVLASIPGNDEGLTSTLISAGLPVDDLMDEGRSFFHVGNNSETLGYGAYELHGQDVLIRSLVIIQSRRGQGLGKVAVEVLLEQARLNGARRAYLLTTSAKSFFQRSRFREIDRATAPAVILQTRQASSLCPSSAALMMRELQE